MRIVAVSDTHADHRDIPYIPDGDVFIHAGDFLNFGYETDYLGGDILGDFYKWIEHLPHKYKILIAGNHDYFLDKEPKRIQELPCTYLQDASIEIEGLKIYGSPWVPHVIGIGSFSVIEGSDMIEKWSLMPNDVDILVTHAAPFGYGDTPYRKGGVVKRSGSEKIQHVGCVDLMNKVKEVKPRIHIFGHIHASSGFDEETDGTRFINVSYDKHRKEIVVIDI